MYYHYMICKIESGIHFKFGCSHLKYARWDIKTASLTVNNNICLVSPVELLVSAGMFQNYNSNLYNVANQRKEINSFPRSGSKGDVVFKQINFF